jgi:hypothetical protein
MMLRLIAIVGSLLLYGCGEPAKAQTVGPPPLYCNKVFQISSGSAGAVIANGVAGQSIHICGYDINAGAAAASFGLYVGTGSICTTNLTNIVPNMSLGINGVMVSRNTTVWYSSPPGYSLCFNITGTGPITAVVSYGQY